MTLFTHSESAYLTSFLSAVDLDSSITPDGSVDPSLAAHVPQLQGREALAQATKDLMALDVPASSSSSSTSTSTFHHPPHHIAHSQPAQGSTPSYWPSIPPAESLSSAALKFGTSGVRSSSPANYLSRGLSSSIAPSDSSRSVPQLERPSSGSSNIFATSLSSQPHLQIAPLRGYDPPGSSSGYTLPPISTSGFPNGASQQESPMRPSAMPSPASAPSVLVNSTTPTSTSVKRSLPSSAQSEMEPNSAKRLRPSPSTSAAAADADATRPRRAAASKSTPAAPRSVSASSNTAAGTQAQTQTNGSSAKGALLSPSQKRANHIQSEQKRRANIRRGYEALCETVPALREAIRAEDERERAKELEEEAAASARGKARGGADKGKKKKKGDGEKADGRAGPRSENVVLQKSACFAAYAFVMCPNVARLAAGLSIITPCFADVLT
ncbi:hypothetical protein C8T65DRAFT_652691 [Cerioporus squamosus]|nr:hypothetical protein C8T65DRAFT_652691 [Cerioporus squamosus]